MAWNLQVEVFPTFHVPGRWVKRHKVWKQPCLCYLPYLLQAYSYEPWFYVDLGSELQVISIAVYGRNETTPCKCFCMSSGLQ